MDGPREDTRIAGYRVLRRLARGTRTAVLLAHGGEPPATVVLKVAAADDPATLREAAALDRGAGEHVIPVLDASADDDRLALVLPRLPGGDLARLLAERAELEGGEAVTVLAPLAATIRRLHRGGVAHGALTAACVLFDAEGAPVLTGFGAAAVFAPDLPEVERERIAEVAADRAALRALTSAVLGRVGGARRPAARRLLDGLPSIRDAVLAERIAEDVFEVAAALPIRHVDPAPSRAVDGRIVPVTAPVPSDHGSVGDGDGGWAARIEGWLDRSPVARLRAEATRRWAAWSRGRRRVVIGAGAGVAILLVALVAIPGGGPPTEVPTASPTGTVAPPVATPITGRGGADRSSDAALRGDDPIAAASALLAARASCRRELSVLCLDGADQEGSAAGEADREAIRAAQNGRELPPDPLPAPPDALPRLVERIGDSALVELAGGASILLIWGAEGWRIRDLMRAPATTSAPSPRG